MAIPKDRYVNKGFATVTQTVADTIEFTRIQQAVAPIGEYRAMILHRVVWDINANAFALLVAAGDEFEMALTLNELDDLEMSRSQVITKEDFHYAGNPAQGSWNEGSLIRVRDFSTLPGGGLLIPVKQLFMGVDSASLGTAITVSCWFYYTVQPVAKDMFYDIAQIYEVLT